MIQKITDTRDEEQFKLDQHYVFRKNILYVIDYDQIDSTEDYCYYTSKSNHPSYLYFKTKNSNGEADNSLEDFPAEPDQIALNLQQYEFLHGEDELEMEEFEI